MVNYSINQKFKNGLKNHVCTIWNIEKIEVIKPNNDSPYYHIAFYQENDTTSCVSMSMYDYMAIQEESKNYVKIEIQENF
jgi:hypothetical protein